jgi:hypothetical protein
MMIFINLDGTDPSILTNRKKCGAPLRPLNPSFRGKSA